MAMLHLFQPVFTAPSDAEIMRHHSLFKYAAYKKHNGIAPAI